VKLIGLPSMVQLKVSSAALHRPGTAHRASALQGSRDYTRLHRVSTLLCSQQVHGLHQRVSRASLVREAVKRCAAEVWHCTRRASALHGSREYTGLHKVSILLCSQQLHG
jgi:hypothetical protein